MVLSTLRGSSSSGATPNANEQSNATEDALKALLGGLDGSEEDKLVSLKAFVDKLESEITSSSSTNPTEDDNNNNNESINTRGRSTRKRKRADTEKKKSTGPCIDATTIDHDRIKEEVEKGGVTNFLNGLDFVNMSDDELEYIFITPRTSQRFPSQTIVHPPKSYRRTVKQIREWYNAMTHGKRTQIMNDNENYTIVTKYDKMQWCDKTSNWTFVVSKAPEEKRYCQGITLQHVENMRFPSEDRRDEKMKGYKYTVREGWVTRSKISHPDNNQWQFAPPVTGVITKVGADKVRWIVEEDAHDKNSCQFKHTHIRAVGCKRNLSLSQGSDLCTECIKDKRALHDRMDSNIDLHTAPFNPNTRLSILERSGSLQKQAVDYHKRESKKKSQKLARRDKVIKRLLDATGMDVGVNDHSDFIFNDEVANALPNFLQKNQLATQDSISEYAFRRAVEKHKKAKEKGAKAVRHCPLMIRLGATLRRAMGFKGGLYDLIAKVAGLPSDRTLRRYTVSNSNDPDGMMNDNCARARSIFLQKYPDAGKFDYSRQVTLAFDSMHTRGRFGVSRNTNELVAIATDAFQDNVIANELKMLNENDSENEDTEMKLPGMAKHFLVFIATTWSSEGKIQFLAARYGWDTLNASKLAREIEKIIFNLAFYGFIVDTITGDGASENRLTFKNLCTISAREILVGTWTEEELDGLPLDFKIAFPHPHPLYRKKINVIIGGEMPHWGKKFRNAYDNKSRQLVFRGKPMSLQMIYDIWLASGDADVVYGAAARMYKFTHDHFKLNSYLKMRVFLALMIPSKSTIKMIRDHCQKDSVVNIEDYEPMIALFEKVDRLVDIMNGTKEDIELINHPRHEHVKELFDILRIFEEWKKESGGYKKSFITSYTHEDLMWMVLGVAAHATLYLDENGDNTMHQGRSGSDVCEHFFSMIRYINSNPTMQQAREGASKVSSGIGMESKAFQQNSKANSGTAQVPMADLHQPIHAKSAKRSKTGR